MKIMYVRHLFQDYASISFVGKKESVNIFDMVPFVPCYSDYKYMVLS